MGRAGIPVEIRAQVMHPVRNSNEIGTDGDLQHDGGVAVAHAIGEPPHRALTHAPMQLVAGEQKRGDLAQRRLMADDEHRFAAVGPAGNA
jgi:hypothetical protein